MKITMGALVVGLVAFLVWALFSGRLTGVLVVALILLAAFGTGLILERVDTSRNRDQGTDPDHDEHWGFRGRPGS